jgi:hypothetical protein
LVSLSENYLGKKNTKTNNKWCLWDVKDKSITLENGFFHYESKDKEFAKKISATLYIFERITLMGKINE